MAKPLQILAAAAMPAVDAGYSTSDRRAANPPANLPRGAKDKKHPMSHNLNGTITVIGIDIGNNSYHVAGLDGRGGITRPTICWRPDGY